MAPPTVMMKVPIPAPIHVPAAPVVDSKTAEVTEPSPEPAAPTQLICGPASFAITPHHKPLVACRRVLPLNHATSEAVACIPGVQRVFIRFVTIEIALWDISEVIRIRVHHYRGALLALYQQ